MGDGHRTAAHHWRNQVVLGDQPVGVDVEDSVVAALGVGAVLLVGSNYAEGGVRNGRDINLRLRSVQEGEATMNGLSFGGCNRVVRRG